MAITAWAVLRAAFEWIGPTYKPYLWALLLFALVFTFLSELLNEPWKVFLRRLGVGLFLAVGAASVFDGLWFLAQLVSQYPFATVGSSLAIGGASSGAIRWLAGWVAKREETRAPSSIAVQLSRYLPQLLAGIVIASMAFLLMFGMKEIGWATYPYSFLPFLCLTVALALVGQLTICVPSTLHRFYRRRIEEAFLRVPDKQDSPLSSTQNWPNRVDRPIQVVNCCASDTCYSTTDQIDRRGANVGLSAVGAYPSGRGVSPGMASPSLSEAITASAAAVDPSMGIYSARLGRLVAFVLFALNLRLGTWWKPNQTSPQHANQFCQYLKSRFSLRPWKEMLSMISLPTPTNQPDHKAYSKAGIDLRLTDGGHFDNLAAYEMIRRRCRYVVICDGGADPGNHFAELSSLQQLVRRDFGVEIEIDLDPLRTDADGISQRHLAAGRILYPRSTFGKQAFSEDGILIYVKPALTGDEPEDLTQYQAASPTFPHETTTDQFFDDHQWEAYRKLGEHSITQDLKFVKQYLEKNSPTNPKLAARLFNAAIRELGSEDHHVRTAKSKNTSRFADLLAKKHAGCIEEVLSELSVIDNSIRDKARQSLLAAMSLLEGQEEAYYRCDLRRHGDHLENWGVENRADRLVASAEVRRWWPVIASLYSIPFRNYLGSKYGLNALLPLVNRDLVSLNIRKLSKYPSPPKSIQRIQRTHGKMSPLENDWVLHASCEIHEAKIDLGALAFSLPEEDKTVRICVDDLQVAPGYWSIGINAILMDALLDFFGFEVGEASSISKPKMPDTPAINPQDIQRVIIEPARQNSGQNPDTVMRPDHRHDWIQRGFVQTRSGLLVRDQKEQKRAGMYCNG